MSLINDALKKAARQRAQDADGLPPMPGASHGRSYARGGPKKTQTMVLIGGGAVVLVVVSVVLTGIMMNKGTPEAKSQAPTAPNPVPTLAASAPKIAVQAAPVAITLPQTAPPAPTALPTPIPTPIVREAPTALPVPVQAAPTAAPAAAPLAPDQIQNLVDNYHISGVRAAGAGSKALIDGHVYKVNDLVDRLLGLRLVKVEEDHLTFTDRTGATYIRAF